jgi:ubiquinone/menaquinone biosynthesis C-methylase UbiE
MQQIKPIRIEGLSATDFSEAYYEEHRNSGLDYLALGDWQKNYGRLVTEIFDQTIFERPVFLDVGCACGTYVMAFRETGVYAEAMGIDISEHMIVLGRRHFGFDSTQLLHGDARRLPLADHSVTLVNSMQMLEHIDTASARQAVGEIARVLSPGGKAFLCLDALKRGQTREDYDYDPTHVNIQPIDWWTQVFSEAGLLFDVAAYERFARSPIGPGAATDSFFRHYPEWSVWTLMRV